MLDLCERFSCLPSQLMAEDAGLLRLLRLEKHGRRRETPEEVDADAQ